MQLEFCVDSALSSSQIGCLLEAGITFVLYQRGQIPLPYQQLQQSALKSQHVDGNGINFKGHQNDLMQNVDKNEDKTDATDSGLNPRQRIALIAEQRRKRSLLKRLEKQNRLRQAMELKAFNAIRPAIDLMQQVLTDFKRLRETTSTNILSIALLLGPSVYCAKEVYYFHLPHHSCTSNENSSLSKVPTADHFSNKVLRQFYKQIITNIDFMDFTSKPLKSTYAHICMVVSGELNPKLLNSFNTNIVRLSNIPSSLLSIVNPLPRKECYSIESSGFSEMTSPILTPKRNRYFEIKIQSSVSNESVETSDYGNSFSSDILFDSNSFSCYQIPLRFKGVQCKNQPM